MMMLIMRNPVAAALMLALMLVGGTAGAGWWLAAHDRDVARVDLVAEQAKSAEYQVAIREQNRAVQAMTEQKTAAEARGQAAQQLAAANGRRFDQALERVASVKATTCDEAMPVVDAMLKEVR